MIVIKISGTTPRDREALDLMFDHLCYGITEDSDIKMSPTSKDSQGKMWSGHSGGDDAYFGLSGKHVRVVVENPQVNEISPI